MTITVRRVTDLEAALEIRRTVFVEEQGVPASLEVDGKDDEAVHFIATGDDEPVGTARLREPDPGVAKAERVAVLPPRRGEGIGRQLMGALEDAARERGCDRVTLHAQTDVEGFYHELGYETTSDVFEEAGIPHVEMERPL
ncbi:MAG: GNAT family N-acetyltransferase [Haloarculaceae archaeon]